MKSILVIRLSSMGDVLLTIPVIRGVLSSNPGLVMTLVTRSIFAPYFDGIDRLSLIPFEPEGRHRGLAGLYTLIREIRRHSFRSVIDLHGIIRTWIIDGILMLSGHRIYRVGKHRSLRRKIVKGRQLDLRVPHTVDRYLAVFEKAGFTGHISGDAFPAPAGETKIPGDARTVLRIGIAPVSKHETKNWGIQRVRDLMHLVSETYHAEFHLFGGPSDRPVLETLSGSTVVNHAGMNDPQGEMALIRNLDLFITMDSANMHLASLLGIPTISVWGATDPRLGFAPLNQPDENAIYADPGDVYCRPCSVYGEIPCKRTDAPMICMETITPDMVLNKISKILPVSGNKF
jgi:ADP-heptose:LPS heptosyltransferase